MDTPVQANPTDEVNIPKTQTQKDGQWIMVVSVAVFIIACLGTVVFLYNQNQSLKDKLASYQTAATPTSTSTPSSTPDANSPTVSSPSAGTKIVSPLKISGTVPAGWMFEGVFPIKLVDSTKKIVAQGQAKEKVAGSWQSGKPVDFTATLTFKEASSSGTLILENDNPSGILANSKTFEIPVVFKVATAYTCPIGGYVDCMPTVGQTKPECSTEAMNWYKINCPDFRGGAY